MNGGAIGQPEISEWPDDRMDWRDIVVSRRKDSERAVLSHIERPIAILPQVRDKDPAARSQRNCPWLIQSLSTRR